MKRTLSKLVRHWTIYDNFSSVNHYVNEWHMSVISRNDTLHNGWPFNTTCCSDKEHASSCNLVKYFIIRHHRVIQQKTFFSILFCISVSRDVFKSLLIKNNWYYITTCYNICNLITLDIKKHFERFVI